MRFLCWLGEVWPWVTSPSVIPWAGALAAIIAALTLEPKTWLKSPAKSAGQALWVVAVWLVIAWVLSSAVRCWSGAGNGPAGPNGGNGDKGTTEDPPTPTEPPTPPVSVKPTCFPPGVPETVGLIVSFVPSEPNSARAQQFSCDLVLKGEGGNDATKIEIRGKDMDEFRKLLAEELHKVNFPQAAEQPTVHIERVPFPGENVLRMVKDKVQETLPNATVEFVEPSKPLIE